MQVWARGVRDDFGAGNAGGRNWILGHWFPSLWLNGSYVITGELGEIFRGICVMQHQSKLIDLPLPSALIRLIDAGIWPSRNHPSMTEQEWKPIISEDRVRRFAPDEGLICFASPPFRSIADHRAAGGAGDFWQRFGALDQIVPEKAICIGDFGLGSDAPIILDYSRDRFDPPVLWLRWSEGRCTEWVEGARNFDQFAEMLGLCGGAEHVP